MFEQDKTTSTQRVTISLEAVLAPPVSVDNPPDRRTVNRAEIRRHFCDTKD
jgi:hypothetical protein